MASVPVVCLGHRNRAPHACTRDLQYCPAAFLFRQSLFCFARGQQHTVLTTAAFRQPITTVAADVSELCALKLRKYLYGVLIVPHS